MKSLLCLSALTLALSAQSATFVQDFTGPFDVTNWALSLQGGAIGTGGAPLSVLFTSANDDSGQSAQTLLITVPMAGRISFNWAYETQDATPLWDEFGVVVNNAFTPVSVASDPAVQSGSYSFTVGAGSRFGFSAQSFDSGGGSATTVISSFHFEEIPAVPEPATLPMMALALGIGVGWHRRAARRGKGVQQ